MLICSYYHKICRTESIVKHVLFQYPWSYFNLTQCFPHQQIEATRNRKTGGLIVDSQPKLRQKAEGGPKSMKVKSPLYVGGLPDQVRTSIISEVSWKWCHHCLNQINNHQPVGSTCLLVKKGYLSPW